MKFFIHLFTDLLTSLYAKDDDERTHYTIKNTPIDPHIPASHRTFQGFDTHLQRFPGTKKA